MSTAWFVQFGVIILLFTFFSVVLGSGQCLEQFDMLRQVLISGPDD